MQIKWTASALLDVGRLHDFLTLLNAPAAAKAVQMLTAAPNSLIANPFLGRRLQEFAPKQIRRLIVGQYEMRYEISEGTVYILRIWHTREDR
jgi:plasmid stabilization system protein ParE